MNPKLSNLLGILATACVILVIAAGVDPASAERSAAEREFDLQIGAGCGAYRATEGQPGFVKDPEINAICRKYGL